MRYGLGVDLGTTFTSAATSSQGHPEMLGLGNRALVAPSVVFATPEGRLLTGDSAARRAADEPHRAASEYKRRLGAPTPLVLGDAPFAPAILMAATLRSAVDAAVKTHGSPPEVIVLSRPAVWGPYRQEQFDEVPRLAGLSDVRMIDEPVAAAAHYITGRGNVDGEIVAVYDLGGGTFDTAVLQARNDELHILGHPEGVEWLGGCDLDEAVLTFVDRQLNGAISGIDPRDQEQATALFRLRQECILAKEALSFDEETVIPVFVAGMTENVRITRAQFEDMARPLVVSTVEALQRAIRSAEVEPADLTAILLVGGSSRIPLVTGMVQDALNRPTVVGAHPKHVVALGAARLADRLMTPDVSEPPTRTRGRIVAGPAVPATRPTPPRTSVQHTTRPVRWVVLGLLIAIAVLSAAAVIGTYYGSRHRVGLGPTRFTISKPVSLQHFW
jgi:molecular chaperone DnaK